MVDEDARLKLPRGLFLFSLAIATLTPVLARLPMTPFLGREMIEASQALTFAGLNAPAGIVLYVLGRRFRHEALAYWMAGAVLVAWLMAIHGNTRFIARGGGDMAAIGGVIYAGLYLFLEAPLAIAAVFTGWAVGRRMSQGNDDAGVNRTLVVIAYGAAIILPAIASALDARACVQSHACAARLEAPKWTPPFAPPH